MTGATLASALMLLALASAAALLPMAASAGLALASWRRHQRGMVTWKRRILTAGEQP